jgi:hypothetical protein
MVFGSWYNNNSKNDAGFGIFLVGLSVFDRSGEVYWRQIDYVFSPELPKDMACSMLRKPTKGNMMMEEIKHG